MKRIVLSNHAARGLNNRRQDGVTIGDVYTACHTAREILFKGVPRPLKLKGFTSEAGVKFDIVVVDQANSNELKVVTVIGTKHSKRYHRNQVDTFKLDHLTYKQRIKYMRKYQKMEKRRFINEL